MKPLIVFFLIFLIVGCNSNRNKPKGENEVAETLDNKILSSIEDDNVIWYEKYLSNQSKIYKNISLPFSSREYINNIDERDNVYAFYYPSDLLVNYLCSKDYEGEDYKCYILSSDSANLIILTWVLRGDSEYYLLMLLNEDKVIDYKEIGKGGDDAISFIIEKDLSVKTDKQYPYQSIK